jgi:hypothetical protein
LPLARHNFFLSPFKDQFYLDSSSIDPSLLPILANVDPKFANQEYSAVMASSMRDDFKDPKFGQVITSVICNPPTTYRLERSQNHSGKQKASLSQ